MKRWGEVTKVEEQLRRESDGRGAAAEGMILAAVAALAEARRGHFVDGGDGGKAQLERAAGQLREAVRVVEQEGVGEHGAALRAAVERLRRERAVSEASHAHAEAWTAQWLRVLTEAQGLDAGYNRQGMESLPATAARVAVEG